MKLLAALSVLLIPCCAASSAHRVKVAHAGMIRIGDVEPETLAGVQELFDMRVRAGDRNILFRIDSFGGSIFDGLDFMQHVEDAKKRNNITVTCVVDTHAMSMGFVFLQDFCDTRLMTKRSVLLAHNGSARAAGTSEEMKRTAKFLEEISNALSEVCAARLNISVAEYKAKIQHADWVFGWEEALAVGAVDGVVNVSDLPPDFSLTPTGLFGSLF